MVWLFGFLPVRKVSYKAAVEFQEEVNQRVSSTGVRILVQLKKELDPWIATLKSPISNSVVKEISEEDFAKAISSFVSDILAIKYEHTCLVVGNLQSSFDAVDAMCSSLNPRQFRTFILADHYLNARREQVIHNFSETQRKRHSFLTLNEPLIASELGQYIPGLLDQQFSLLKIEVEEDMKEEKVK